MTKFQETMASAGAAAFSRLTAILTPFLLALLGWYYVGADAVKTRALDEMRAQLVAMSIQIARLEEQGGGTRTNQATIDGEQNRRLDRLEARVGAGEPF